jgi:hypothetical protein
MTTQVVAVAHLNLRINQTILKLIVARHKFGNINKYIYIVGAGLMNSGDCADPSGFAGPASNHGKNGGIIL